MQIQTRQQARYKMLGLLLFVTSLVSCSAENRHMFLTGETMGTTYTIEVATLIEEDHQVMLADQIRSRLDQLDRQIFSTYTPKSEVSRFNSLGLRKAMRVSSEFIEVLESAETINQLSNGSFDITIAPLVQLWGFGPGPDILAPPDQHEIDLLMQQRGLDAIKLGAGNSLVKVRPRMLDFSAIAKGFAADSLADLLEQNGIENYLVEIGGEVISRGLRADGEEWHLAIEQPAEGSRQPFTLMGMSGSRKAVAGSGTYRNYIELDGKHYSHEIDPRTGSPVENNLISVTVIHDEAMFADAWATAFMVMGVEEALAVAEQQNLPVYLIGRSGDEIITRHNSLFEPYLRQ